MKGIVICIITLLSTANCIGQVPVIKAWDYRYGGVNDDGLITTLQTKDGGYLLGGESRSGASGDKTQPNWDTSSQTDDYWIVKLNAAGQKEWDKRYGGNDEDVFGQMRPTRDGGYMLGGFSASGISGDKTQALRGGLDYWIVKLDSAGNKQWDKDYGGDGEDDLYDLLQTKDGGYILGGQSYSGIGGDKTQDNWDPTYQTPDFWVVKIDSVGNKQWDKDFGGNDFDMFVRIIETKDGGYLLGGSTRSDSGGNVSYPPRGVEDAWFVKIDSLGNMQWDTRLGGLPGSGSAGYPSFQTPEGGFILACGSNSDSGGDKSQNTFGGDDDWIVYLDSSGHKIWDKDFGGPGDEALTYLMQTKDGGYLMSGTSGSNAGGDKTENNLGQNQIWMLKTDSDWREQWDKTIFTTANNDEGYTIEDAGGCYVTSDGTWAGIGGYKTQPNWDSNDVSGDYWVVKFCFTGYGEGINSVTDNLQFNVYPNPFTSELDITLSQQNLHRAAFTITNLLGQIIYKQQENNLSPTYTKMLDLSYLPNGVYLVAVTVNGERMVREVVKQ